MARRARSHRPGHLPGRGVWLLLCLLPFVAPTADPAEPAPRGMSGAQPADARRAERPEGPAWQAYRSYAERVERSFVASAEAGSEGFLHIDGLGDDERDRVRERLREGDVPVFEVDPRTPDGGEIDVPDGSLHHWIAVVLVPGAGVDDVLELLQDYDRHGDVYAPDITEGEILDRRGQEFTIRHRFRIEKVVTVVFDTFHEVRYRRLAPGRAHSVSHTTSVREVRDAHGPEERVLAEGEGREYLRAMSSYWRYADVEGGTIVEAQTVTLAGELPALLGIFASVGDVPRDMLVSMLRNTRQVLLPSAREGRRCSLGDTPDTVLL